MQKMKMREKFIKMKSKYVEMIAHFENFVHFLDGAGPSRGHLPVPLEIASVSRYLCRLISIFKYLDYMLCLFANILKFEVECHKF